jgi:hypothetical protein
MQSHDTAPPAYPAVVPRSPGRAIDSSFAAVPEAASAARLVVVDAFTGRVDGRVLADARNCWYPSW